MNDLQEELKNIIVEPYYSAPYGRLALGVYRVRPICDNLKEDVATACDALLPGGIEVINGVQEDNEYVARVLQEAFNMRDLLEWWANADGSDDAELRKETRILLEETKPITN